MPVDPLSIDGLVVMDFCCGDRIGGFSCPGGFDADTVSDRRGVGKDDGAL